MLFLVRILAIRGKITLPLTSLSSRTTGCFFCLRPARLFRSHLFRWPGGGYSGFCWVFLCFPIGITPNWRGRASYWAWLDRWSTYSILLRCLLAVVGVRSNAAFQFSAFQLQSPAHALFGLLAAGRKLAVFEQKQVDLLLFYTTFTFCTSRLLLISSIRAIIMHKSNYLLLPYDYLFTNF